ncbi:MULTISPECIES: hypothetical protein [Lentibacter]|jgi:hypothetical protein|uniref:Uncharacterized protein n=3 Tax=Lentibacter algarum TaxID=576131 RepID=A0A1H3HRT4_9RHOB|nr:hypothetical protein [Lentibacter algarum]MCO4776121.1 hypothetical protein [Lentibacter algarum]WIF31083.1 hypothetical protein LentiSH36_00599 [Lentibacter algarum]SDY18142.1 hypothetical protein SAMN05444486_101619 [Lentibacter algarum]
MKPSRIAFAAALVLGLGLSGRALWQTAHPPDPASAYLALFENHCVSRLAKAQSGSDPFATLVKNEKRITRLDSAGLQAIQSRDICEVKDATRLMTEAQRDTAVASIVAFIAAKLPELSEHTDPLDWDLHRAFTAQTETNNWGIILMRIEPDSADALQSTTTTLALPRG